jgi:hypothetical protein
MTFLMATVRLSHTRIDMDCLLMPKIGFRILGTSDCAYKIAKYSFYYDCAKSPGLCPSPALAQPEPEHRAGLGIISSPSPSKPSPSRGFQARPGLRITSDVIDTHVGVFRHFAKTRGERFSAPSLYVDC